MAYREQEAREVCSFCSEWAIASCPRCARPLCDEHDGGDDRRCPDCEQDFVALVKRSDEKLPIDLSNPNTAGAFYWGAQVFVPFLGLVFVGIGVLLALAGGLWAIIGAPAAMIICLMAIGALMKRYAGLEDKQAEIARLRRRFLAEQKHLPAPAENPTEE